MTRRLVFFALLGPLLGFVTGFWGLLQILTVAVGDKSTAEFGQIVLLPSAYILGLIPAIVTGLIDHRFRHLKFGPLYTCLAGYLLAFAPIVASILMGFMHGPYLLFFGLVGAIPALVCSLIVRKLEQGKKYG